MLLHLIAVWLLYILKIGIFILVKINWGNKKYALVHVGSSTTRELKVSKINQNKSVMNCLSFYGRNCVHDDLLCKRNWYYNKLITLFKMYFEFLLF